MSSHFRRFADSFVQLLFAGEFEPSIMTKLLFFRYWPICSMMFDCNVVLLQADHAWSYYEVCYSCCRYIRLSRRSYKWDKSCSTVHSWLTTYTCCPYIRLSRQSYNWDKICSTVQSRLTGLYCIFLHIWRLQNMIRILNFICSKIKHHLHKLNFRNIYLSHQDFHICSAS